MVANTTPSQALTSEQIAGYAEQGYLIVKGMFTPPEVAAIRDFFDDLAAGPWVPGHWESSNSYLTAEQKNDPLFRYPRFLHPHRLYPLAKEKMLQPGVQRVLEELLGEEAVACQSMYYYKPPGARGQALHQDNIYLNVRPNTCIAAWTAIDPAWPVNGGMYLVPGSHKLDLLCPEQADMKESFTGHLVNPPKGMKAVPAVMEPGDTLFFNGSVIHGSGANRHLTLWRRSFICHYMPRSSQSVSKWYFPVYAFDGREIPYDASADGGPCGFAGAAQTAASQVH